MKYVKLIALIMAALLCTAAVADLSGMVNIGVFLSDIGHEHTHDTVVRPAPEEEKPGTDVPDDDNSIDVPVEPQPTVKNFEVYQ